MTSPAPFPIHGSAMNTMMPGKLRNLVHSNKPEINIHLESRKRVFSTLDRIEGTVKIKAPVDTDFDEIDIEFVGTARTYVERLTTAAAVSGRSEAFHNFLRLSQPNLERLLPADLVLRAGKTYVFPFVFAVPQQLLPHICKHTVANPAVRDAHLQLPPTFGDQELASKDGALDDMAPEMASVRYGIFAKLSKTTHNGESETKYPIANKACRLRIVPAIEEAPPLDLDWKFQAEERSDYVMRREKKLRKGLLKGKLGTMVIEAQQPKSLHLPASDCVSEERVTSMATVMLRFEPVEGVTQTPRMDKITSKLKVRTYFAALARHDFPKKADSEFDASKGMHGETMDLASRCISNIDWRLEDPKASEQIRRASAASVNQGWIPESSATYKKGSPYYIAKLVVPVDLPTHKNFVPTFHSCLVSRTYTLSLSLSLQTAGLGGSMDLRIPIQISSSPSCGIEDSRRRSSVASATLDTDVEDDLTDFFAPRNTISPPSVSDSPPDFEDVPAMATFRSAPSEAFDDDAPPGYADHTGVRFGNTAVERQILPAFPAVR